MSVQKIKHILSLPYVRIGISILIIGLTFLYIINQVSKFQHSGFNYKTLTIDSKIIFPIILVFALMIINWSVESLKWRYALVPIMPITFIQSIKAVVGSVTLAVVTPNRVGEIGGRAAFLPSGNRKTAVAVTALSSLSQLITTMLFAVVSVPFLFDLSETITFLFIVFALVCLNFFMQLPKILHRFRNMFLIRNIYQRIYLVSLIDSSRLFGILLYSIGRYSIFIIQYYILLHMFDVKIGFVETLLAVGATYGLSSLIPTIALAELGLRGTAAIICFGIFSDNTIGIIAATVFLWTINVALPSLVGVLFLFNRLHLRRRH